MEKILLVDDERNVLLAYKRHLYGKFKIFTAESGKEALDIIKSEGPFAVVVADYRMPGMDGIHFLYAARELAPETVRIMLTGYADLEGAIEAVNRGNVFRFLTKPCPPEDFLQAVTAGVEQYRLVTAERELLEKTLKGSVKLMLDILSTLSPVAFGQSSRLSNMAGKVARRLGIEKPWEVELAVMLSQIGCVAIPQKILYKKLRGDPLTEEENETFQGHPMVGSRLLANIPRLEDAARAVKYQLKQYDGGGVPDGDIRGKAIPPAARILKALLDYDTMTTAGEKPLRALDNMRGYMHCYDPEVYAALEAEVMSVEQGFVVRGVSWREITPGMLLADDVRNKFGTVLVARGSEITDVLKERIINFARYGNIVEPIKVLERRMPEKEN